MAAKHVRRFLSTSILVFLAVVAAVSVAAQQDGATSGITVRGVVVNGLNQQPVARALVVIEPRFATLTGDDGSFTLYGIPAGRHSLSVRRPGFVDVGSGPGMAQPFQSGRHDSHPLPPVQLNVGDDMGSITVAITPEAGIAGQVTLSTGDAAGGIRLSFFRHAISNGRPHWRMAGTVTTRTDGSFHLDGLEPGRYMLYTQGTLDLPLAAGGSRVQVRGYPPVYYPGVIDPTAAGILSLGAGQHAEADFSLVRQRFFPITVHVMAPGSQGYVGLELLDAGGRPTGFPVRYNAREQLAHLEAPNGSWSLVAHAYGKAMLFGQADLQVAGSPEEIAIQLQPLPHIPVNITRDLTSPEEQQSTQPQGPGLSLLLTAASTFDAGGYGGYLTPKPGSQGNSWQVVPSRPGRYWVQASAFPPAYVASITSGGVDLAAAPLVILPGSDPSPINITLRNDSGKISGLIDGESASAGATPGVIPHVWVYAIPLFPYANGLTPQAFFGPDGTFTFYALTPGHYRLVACDRQQQIDSHSPDEMAAWAGLGKTVTVEPGGSAQVTLELLHTVPAP